MNEMCSELGWIFPVGKPLVYRSTGEAVNYQYEYDPAILVESDAHIEKRMRQLRGSGESYESQVQAWCRRLGEDLKAESILNHWELAHCIHTVDGAPWVKSQPLSEAQLQLWHEGDRWVLLMLLDGEPCAAGILTALAGEEEGEHLVDHMEPKILVSFRDRKLVLCTKSDSGSESTPAMTVDLENPKLISIMRLPGMDDVEATDFQATAAMFCGGVTRTLDPDSKMVQTQAQHLHELKQKQKERTGKPG